MNKHVLSGLISASGRWSTHARPASAHAIPARRRDGDIDVVTDDEPLRAQGHAVIRPLDTWLKG